MTSHAVCRCLAMRSLSLLTSAGRDAPAATSDECLNFNNVSPLTSVNALPAWSAGLNGRPASRQGASV